MKIRYTFSEKDLKFFETTVVLRALAQNELRSPQISDFLKTHLEADIDEYNDTYDELVSAAREIVEEKDV